MNSLKKMLCKLIDPAQKVYDLKELTEDFDYPREDIFWLELNEMH